MRCGLDIALKHYSGIDGDLGDGLNYFILADSKKNYYSQIMNVSHFFASVVVVFGLTCIIFVSRLNVKYESYKITGFNKVLVSEKAKRQVVLGERNHSKTNENGDFCRLCTDYR